MIMAQATSPDDVPSLCIETAFGVFTVDPDAVVRFPSGLPGFEKSQEFVVLSSSEIAPFSCLHSVSGPSASFLVIDPRAVLDDYRCALSQADLQRLAVSDDRALLWLAIVSVDDLGQACANLRAPIAINPQQMLGSQVMPHNSQYSLRHPLPPE